MWKWLLRRVLAYIVGNDVFVKIQKLVAEVALDDTLSSTQKREKVLAEAKTFAKNIEIHLINLAIESAVVLMKENS